MKKNILGAATLGLLAVGVSLGYYYGFTGDKVSANPDYICVKSVSNPSCDVTSCGDWQTDHTRTCTGNKVTQVGYYHTRTSCEAGYSAVIHGTTKTSTSASTQAPTSSLDAEGRAATTSHPSSGRHGSNFTYSSTTCSVVETDTIKPVGKFLNN